MRFDLPSFTAPDFSRGDQAIEPGANDADNAHIIVFSRRPKRLMMVPPLLHAPLCDKQSDQRDSD